MQVEKLTTKNNLLILRQKKVIPTNSYSIILEAIDESFDMFINSKKYDIFLYLEEEYGLTKQSIQNNKEYNKTRQAIVEHPYGTIKRQWGFSYILTKKYIERAEADVGLMFTAYNLRRLINIIGIKALERYLRTLVMLFITVINRIRVKTKRCNDSNYLGEIFRVFINSSVNHLKFTCTLNNNGSF